jgi:hypothetical protein
MRLAVEGVGWRGALLVLAAVQAQMIVAAMMFLPNPDLKEQPVKEANGQLLEKGNTKDEKTIENNIELVGAQELQNFLSDSVLDVGKNGTAVNAKEDKKCVDLSIFKNSAFVAFFIGFPFADIGGLLYVSYAYPKAVHQGIDPVSASAVLSAFGICSIIGRVCSGVVGNLRCVGRLYLAACCVLTASVACATSVFAGDSIILHCAVSATFGFFNGLTQILNFKMNRLFDFMNVSGGYHSLYSTLLVDLIGVPDLARAMGYLLIAKCLLATGGLPLGGKKLSYNNNGLHLIHAPMLHVS